MKDRSETTDEKRLRPGCGEFTISIAPDGKVTVDFATTDSIKVLERFADVEVENCLCG